MQPVPTHKTSPSLAGAMILINISKSGVSTKVQVIVNEIPRPFSVHLRFWIPDPALGPFQALNYRADVLIGARQT